LSCWKLAVVLLKNELCIRGSGQSEPVKISPKIKSPAMAGLFFGSWFWYMLLPVGLVTAPGLLVSNPGSKIITMKFSDG
jgi:hypothetical protein